MEFLRYNMGTIKNHKSTHQKMKIKFKDITNFIIFFGSMYIIFTSQGQHQIIAIFIFIAFMLQPGLK